MGQLEELLEGMEMKTKTCTNCRKELPWDAFTIREKGKPRSQCKKCRSEIQCRKVAEANLEKRPDDHYECLNEDCGHIWNKVLGSLCPKCKTCGVIQ